jgi:hypothetical protein
MNHDDYIEELKAAILNVHGATAMHVKTVPVTEEFQGKTVWQGEVEVFDIHGHPKAKRAYGWGFVINENQGRKYVAVLEVPPVNSPLTAVQAAIMSEIKNGKSKKGRQT